VTGCILRCIKYQLYYIKYISDWNALGISHIFSSIFNRRCCGQSPE